MSIIFREKKRRRRKFFKEAKKQLAYVRGWAVGPMGRCVCYRRMPSESVSRRPLSRLLFWKEQVNHQAASSFFSWPQAMISHQGRRRVQTLPLPSYSKTSPNVATACSEHKLFLGKRWKILRIIGVGMCVHVKYVSSQK